MIATEIAINGQTDDVMPLTSSAINPKRIAPVSKDKKTKSAGDSRLSRRRSLFDKRFT
jgi:hypothetical protein